MTATGERSLTWYTSHLLDRTRAICQQSAEEGRALSKTLTDMKTFGWLVLGPSHLCPAPLPSHPGSVSQRLCFLHEAPLASESECQPLLLSALSFTMHASRTRRSLNYLAFRLNITISTTRDALTSRR